MKKKPNVEPAQRLPSMNRRGFFALTAAAMIAVASVTRLGGDAIRLVRERLTLMRDGINDDTTALQALLDDTADVYLRDGRRIDRIGGALEVPQGSYRISSPLYVRVSDTAIEGAQLFCSANIVGPWLYVENVKCVAVNKCIVVGGKYSFSRFQYWYSDEETRHCARPAIA